MTASILTIAGALVAAAGAGAVIGFERTMHGREGFRTHALVAVAAATAVLAGQGDVAAASRLAQGVMTGIGFVGAGVIFKEGVSVQGLTTAASMWSTAAIGLLMGVGDYLIGAIATAVVLVVLIALRWLEAAAPGRVYAWASFGFEASATPGRAGLDALLAARGAAIRELSYARTEDGRRFEFKGVLIAPSNRVFDSLAESLGQVEGLAEFELSRINK
ncbi:MAG: MgtC/SapB family protein [Proteobacteria bacterium]|nr:MgtC/SapB family protein [Pseudomonadota bacterium]